MKIARVTGTVVSTVKIDSHKDFKIMVVQPVDDLAEPYGDTFLAIDTAQAGVGDYVLVVEEGKAARQLMDRPEAPCEAIIVGVIDYVETGGKQRVLEPGLRGAS